MPDAAVMLDAAREAVALASGVCRRVQAQLDSVRSITKDDKSPVTVADFASQAVVARTLRERLGDIVLVAEEASDFLREPDHRPHLDAVVEAVRTVWDGASEGDVLAAIDVGGAEATDAFWTLDPIDGTKGFLRNQQYAVALGYVEGGEPTLGVLGCPNLPREMESALDEPDATGSLYFGIRGEGVREAASDDPKAEATPITRLDHVHGEDVCITGSVEKAHSDTSAEGRILKWLEETRREVIGESVRLDSQCKYAVVARGQADAYLRMPTKPGYVERIWDHAAGALVATEAGAVVSDIFGKPLDFSHGRGLETNKGVICAPPRLHSGIIEAIGALGIQPA